MSSRKAALASLRATKKDGVKRSQQFELKEEKPVYEELTEEAYTKFVKERRAKEGDSIIDDEGLGYAEYGDEVDWDEDDFTEKKPKSTNKKKQSKSKTRNQKESPVNKVTVKHPNRILEMLMNGSKDEQKKRKREFNIPPSLNKNNTKTQSLDDDDFLESELAALKADPLGKRGDGPTLASKKLKTFITGVSGTTSTPHSRAVASKIRSHALTSNNPEENKMYDSDEDPLIQPKEKESKSIKTSSNTTQDVDVKNHHKAEDYVDEDDLDFIFANIKPSVKSSNINLTESSSSTTTITSVNPTVAFFQSTSSSDTFLDPKLTQTPTSAPLEVEPVLVNDEGKLLFYWLDACEIKEKPGCVFVFGKVRTESGKMETATILVKNIPRILYAAPRPFKYENGKETDILVDIKDVESELQMIAKKHKISRFFSKPVIRRYAFEQDVPDQPTQWIKMLYPANDPLLPRDLSGENFSHIFGTNTSTLETFLVLNKIKGPGWLLVGNISASLKFSWGNFEGEISDYRHMEVVTEDNLNSSDIKFSELTSPPLSVLSLHLKTYTNPKTNATEILCISCVVHRQILSDRPTPNPKQQFQCIALIRPIPRVAEFSVDIRRNVAALNRAPHALEYILCSSETTLLETLLEKFRQLDPDVVVGHNFSDYHLDILLHRMSALRIKSWSLLGRLKREKYPRLQAGPGGMHKSTYAEKAVLSGRLLCDSYLTAKEFVRAKSYSLGELCKQVLGEERNEKSTGPDFDDPSKLYSNPERLVQWMNAVGDDAYLSMMLVLRLNVLPLTKQLTNECGNLWARSLTSARAERIEFLLLHEYATQRPKFVVPDPVQYQGKFNGKKGKAKYSGGLVLTPKKGLYESFILLLDFKSLYPSIILEYNICHTTVSRWIDPDSRKWVTELPDMEPKTGPTTIPPTTQSSTPEVVPEVGVLPKVISRLVQKRSEAKREQNGRIAGSSDWLNLEIKQLALKLVANSMYGCLGFSGSRFCCTPLAEVITKKGREALEETQRVANREMKLEVVYGDTDSIMIDTKIKASNDDSEMDVKKKVGEVKLMGRKVVAVINRRYKSMELEIDGVFRSLLLLNKKKYAALVLVDQGPGKPLAWKKEEKGLDVVRRDWCALARETGKYCVDAVLGSSGDVVEEIHKYLQQIADQARSGEVELEKYVITKCLTKEPDQYREIKGLPHVQVAQKMRANNKRVAVGDFIRYVVCKGDGGTAERAFDVDDVRVLADDGLVEVDVEWYLGNQVHPVVSRICGEIEGTDMQMIAECLGLDPKKFTSRGGGGTGGSNRFSGVQFEDDLKAFGKQNDVEKFRGCTQMEVRCSKCKTLEPFGGVLKDGLVIADGKIADVVMRSGFECGTCGKEYGAAYLQNKVTLECKAWVARYYARWLVCEELCGNKLRGGVGKLGRDGRIKCYGGCRGCMVEEFGAKQLHMQLCYLQSLFDIDRFKRQLPANQTGYVDALVSYQQVQAFRQCKAKTQKFLDKNSYAWIGLGSLFGPCGIQRNK